MRGERVAKRVRRHALAESRFLAGPRDRTLHGALVHMMAHPSPEVTIVNVAARRKQPRPTPIAKCAWILARKTIGERHEPRIALQILQDLLDLLQLKNVWHAQRTLRMRNRW